MNKFTYVNRELLRLTQGVQITEDVLYMYRISSIKRRLVINARPPIHAGWLQDCTLINSRSPIHTGVICEGRGKCLKVAARMLWHLVRPDQINLLLLGLYLQKSGLTDRNKIIKNIQGR